jgi:1,4-dihydroxy-6-naphthoate synthase
MKDREITVAHSPDADDAFMFYALAAGKLDTDGLSIKQVMRDIQSLNKEAVQGTYDVTAISFAAYPNISDKYFLMPCGSSMGEGYGPIVVTTKEVSLEKLSSARIAIPGKQTTAYLCLRLFQSGLNVVEMPFDQIIGAVQDGSVDAGLLIHEGQLTYGAQGLNKILDLGEWWQDKTGLPLPLGGNAIRKDLGKELIAKTIHILKEAILYSLNHREEALTYALTFARDLPHDLANRYVGMYVNELTVDCGEKGQRAVKRLFEEAKKSGIIEQEVIPEFAS